jgi:hypothetical protein
MTLRDTTWLNSMSLMLVLVPAALVVGAVLSLYAQPPCKRSEWRRVDVAGGKYGAGGPRDYEVCVERQIQRR